MSMKPTSIPPVPEETARVAQAAFPKGSFYLRLRDEFGAFYEDEDFAALFPARGQPGLPPWRLALVTVMQFLENLSDRQAADAVRGRIDWKYALSLELTDSGFDYSVLSEFRSRLIEGGAETRLLDCMLERLRERTMVKARGRQRTDSTHVLASIRVLNQLELVAETLRATLNDLAHVAPDWLRGIVPPEWYERYGARIEDTRLPQGNAARAAYGRIVGADGFDLLGALEQEHAPQEARQSEAAEILRRVWARHFERTEKRVHLRAGRELARAGEALESPYDPEAQFRTKRNVQWTGYRVHLTETCDVGKPHLVTHVETTSAAVHEAMRTEAIHCARSDKGLPPEEHLVDAAYVSAESVVNGQETHGIRVLGPPRSRANWQAKVEGAYTDEHFQIDWNARQAVCPQGKESLKWHESQRRTGEPFVVIRFRGADCKVCPARSSCTRAKTEPRQLFLKPRAQHEALQILREQLDSDEGKRLYACRAGVEGTISQGVRAFGLRQARYRGLAKVHLQHVVTAAAINLARLGAWEEGRPHARSRTSRFARLAA